MALAARHLPPHRHHELEGKPQLAIMVADENEYMAGSGRAWVLSDLKTLLESGNPMVSGEWLQQE